MCYLDCVCGIKLFPNSSVSQPQTQGDHPSFLLWPLCHMMVTWHILSSHMMPIAQLSLRISYRVTQLCLSQIARRWSLSPQCPTLPSEPSDGPHLLLPLWTCYTSIIVLSLNSEENIQLHTLMDELCLHSWTLVWCQTMGGNLAMAIFMSRFPPILWHKHATTKSGGPIVQTFICYEYSCMQHSIL